MLFSELTNREYKITSLLPSSALFPGLWKVHSSTSFPFPYNFWKTQRDTYIFHKSIWVVSFQVCQIF